MPEGAIQTTVIRGAVSSTQVQGVMQGALGQTIVGAAELARRTDYVATAGQTVFDLDWTYSGDKPVYVFVNGVLLPTADYASPGGDAVTLDSGVAAGTKVAVLSFMPGFNDPLPWYQDLLFDMDRSVAFRARRAMTVRLAGQIGTGAISVQASTPAAPTIFEATSFPFFIQAGGWMRVTATGVEDLLAAQIEQVG